MVNEDYKVCMLGMAFHPAQDGLQVRFVICVPIHNC
jgi:hypothetical protein